MIGTTFTMMMNPSTSDDATERTRIGIDFGNTIGEVEDEQPAPYAYEMICHLVHKCGPKNVFIISKAGPEMEQRIRSFLNHTHFCEQCGFLVQNILFVREYLDKATLVQSLGISIFLDDHSKVVRSLAPLPGVRRIFWMHANPREIYLIAKEHRSKIAIVKEWQKTMKYFQRL
mmetsp:Transcript_27453/g.75629  ORF Transcript_27453/g.75629 Transcript_27453/m.75629 type:complete len:173 (+) Transcript_27453:47-565(+)